MSNKRVMFAGPSGIGKTTLAKMIEEELNLPFVDVTYSKLFTETKDIPHVQMLNVPITEMQTKETQLLKRRADILFRKDQYVTDRSYIDNAAYFTYKLSKHMPTCETEAFIDMAESLLTRDCTHLIFMPLRWDAIFNWQIEDNKKRITNGYFQATISQIMENIIQSMGFEFRFFSDSLGTLHTKHGNVKVLFLTSLDYETRRHQILKFLR